MMSGMRWSARRRRRSADVGADADVEFASCFALRRSKRERVRDLSAVSLGVGLESEGSEMSNLERSRDCEGAVGAVCVGLDRIWSRIRLIFSFCACVWTPIWHLSCGKFVMVSKANESDAVFADLCSLSTSFPNC